MLTTNCPYCGCFEQHIGISCGYCGQTVPAPAGTDAVIVADDGEDQEIYSYKALIPDGDGLLHSPQFDMVWTPGEWMTAECDEGQFGHHSTHPDKEMRPPVMGCRSGHGCGFYVARDRRHMTTLVYIQNAGAVMAKIHCAGLMIPATNGFRVQHAKITEVYIPHMQWRQAVKIKAAYEPSGVAIDLQTTTIMPKDEELKWCPKCTVRWKRGADQCRCCGYSPQGGGW